MDDLSRRIDEAMRIRGMSQADLCRATKMGSSKISYILQGKTTDPRMSTLIKIADALDISLDYLAGTRDDAAPRLTRDESVLLSDYRDCTPERRRKAADAVRDQRVLSQAQEGDGRSFDDLIALIKDSDFALDKNAAKLFEKWVLHLDSLDGKPISDDEISELIRSLPYSEKDKLEFNDFKDLLQKAYAEEGVA